MSFLDRASPRSAPSLPPRIAPLVAVFLGLAAAMFAAGFGDHALLLLIGGIGALAALLLAALRPALFLLGLLVVVILQDALVGAGIVFLQPADEALVLLAIAGIVLRALWARAEWRWRRSPLDLPTLGFCAVGALAAFQKSVPLAVAALGMLAYLKGMLVFQLAARMPLAALGSHRAQQKRASQKDSGPERSDAGSMEATGGADSTKATGGAASAASHEGTSTGLEPALVFLAGLAAFMALVALAQRLGGEPVFAATGHLLDYQKWAGGKSPSLFFNHNAFGHVVVFGGALALGQALFAGSRAERKLWAAFALVSGLGLLLSASRESWLGAAAGLMLAATLQRSRRLTRLVVVLVATLAIGGALVYTSSETMQDELERRTRGVTEGWHDYQLGFTGWKYRGEYRVYVILKSWEVFVDQPLLGTGPGRFGGHVATRYPTPVYDQYGFLPLDGAFIPLDVFWSRLLTEMGLLGSAFYVWALGAALHAFWLASRSRLGLTRGLGLGGIVAWAAVMVFGVFAPALEDPLTAIPFWAWAGLAWCLHERETKPEPRMLSSDEGRIL